ncbi:Rne/Rng family ribonuclease [Methyloferula stellata]|uniref:Rne/Rng family ribonuclease n=1 Tax=Methyloferula stellata TaxID=876270 RepID=UPI0003677E16|nr:ribonuclease E/G [Methyloferula stellata]
MANKMLIDASHPEETRVVVLRGNRVEEFDFESANKKQLRGNIYLAKVTRVEPSLQAAFVDYGGNRHGFLAFSEIHPDYYQIPVGDRQALIEEDARAQREEDEDEPRSRRSRRHSRGDRNGQHAAKRHGHEDETLTESAAEEGEQVFEALSPGQEDDFGDDTGVVQETEPSEEEVAEAEAAEHEHRGNPDIEPVLEIGDAAAAASAEDSFVHVSVESESAEAEYSDEAEGAELEARRQQPSEPDDADGDHESDETDEEAEHVEQLGGDAMEEMPVRSYRSRRQYKIQEVIKRRQVLLVQVVKEERGNKGAALTTYLSLAGRYSVLMPNTARGGGISRKITDAGDRQRLKSIAQELEVPEGMGVILRTAGAARTKAEVKRDFEYLLRMWETVREMTLKSTAPTLVYEEGSLIKRAIRDLYNKDIDEVVVSGDDGYREAKEFMRMLMPSHAKNVQPYRDPQPIFAKAGAEAQLDAMFSNQVTLKSGGYLVINQTEALVAIDVNSGRSTREHNIEDTALRTNLEASDEIARQLRLRDLAGLIVVDFIDMEENRNNRSVERRLKEALKNDRARIQVGRISHFGLLEMSRQRIRTGVLEGSTVVCSHCAGAGMVRSTSSIALHVLRVTEDTLIKSATHNITVKTRSIVALYILNQKRDNLHDLETRFGVTITITPDDSLTGTTYHAIERGELASGTPEAAPRAEFVRTDSVRPADIAAFDEEDADLEAEADEESGAEETNGEGEGEADANGDNRRRKRRRRRRSHGGDREGSGIAANAPQPSDDGLAVIAAETGAFPPVSNGADYEAGDEERNGEAEPEGAPTGEGRRRRSRRRGRGGRDFASNGEKIHISEAGAGEDAVAASAFEMPVSEAFPAEAAAAEAPAPSHETEHSGYSDAGHASTEHPGTEHSSTEHAAEGDVQVREPVAAEAPAPHAPSPAPVVAEEDPNRPKRTGWWQRARASLGG